MDKPFKGIISDWRLSDGRIVGISLFEDCLITTSPVVEIDQTPNQSVFICETKNSRYALI